MSTRNLFFFPFRFQFKKPSDVFALTALMLIQIIFYFPEYYLVKFSAKFFAFL